MAFQSTVFFNQGFGVIGELFSDSPWHAESVVVYTSGHPEYNVIGRAATVVSGSANLGGVTTVSAGGTGAYMGILANPKQIALFGANGLPLDPTLALPNYTQVDVVSKGSLIVYLPAAANIGDYVIFDQTDGTLSTITPGTMLPSGHTFANALVDYFDISAAGLAVITLAPQYQNI